MNKSIDTAALLEWINNNCGTFRTNTVDDFKSKIDFLERAIEIARYESKYLDNNIEFEEVINGRINVEEGKLIYTSPPRIVPMEKGTKPLLLQPKLLLFLLLYHNYEYRVYDIIEKFIFTIWNQLSILDFKKTETGVTRCFTNTRFAANTLRKYGLLKFTKREAFKTWTLSLYGFIVASDIIQNAEDWNLAPMQDSYRFELHQDILFSTNKINKYDDFVDKLTAICQPKIALGLFKTFEGILREAYNLLGRYWRIARDPDLTKNERQEESYKRLIKLEKHPDIERFYTELSSCIYVDSFMKKLIDQK